MSNRTTVEGTVALVTGANRGIGAAFVSGLLDAGAKRVYAAARDPQTLTALAHSDARVVPIALDITDDTSVQAATARLLDIDLLVNNAGVLLGARLIAAADLAAARQEMEVNYFGLLSGCCGCAEPSRRSWPPMAAAR
jgi:NADP-dependent 3-hydroxy acid dehydrogenase YdfG